MGVTIPEFIAKWRKVELKERSAAQEHFIDLCRLVGHPTPAEADPSGADFCFEMDRIVVRTNFTGTAPATFEIPLEKLNAPAAARRARTERPGPRSPR